MYVIDEVRTKKMSADWSSESAAAPWKAQQEPSERLLEPKEVEGVVQSSACRSGNEEGK